MNYILSNYNHYLEKDDSILVLNCVSRAVIEFEKTSFRNLLQKINKLPDSEISYLIDNRIIVNPNINEYEDYRSKFESDCDSDEDLTLTIGFTFQCNFNCAYCIQKENYHDRESLTIEKANQILQWIEKAISKNTKSISINYFGGEPTLNLKVVYYFADQINKLCKKYGLNPYHQMVTNGFALTEIKIKKLISLGINDYQITLDGLKDDHNKRRSRTFDSFSKIIENIVILSQNYANIFVLNVFDTSNYKSSFDLIDYFDELSNNHTEIISQVMFNFSPTIPKKVETVTCNKYIEGNELFLSKEAVNLFLYCSQKGFGHINFLDIDRCFRQVKNSVLISPDLLLYKCYSVFGNTKYSVGSINNDFNQYIELSKKYSLANGFTKQCEGCNVAPLCRGGCQFAASEINNGNYGHMYCEKDNIIEYINGFLTHKLF